MKTYFTFAILCAGAFTVSPCAAAAEGKPNVIIIVGDDMGYGDVGVHGCQDIPTPHLDALAAAGVRCTNGYVSGPYCSPTRAGLLTGRYQTRFGHEFNPGSSDRDKGPLGLPLTETTLADRMKTAGYATGMVGKWHLGNAEAYRPPRRGFDEFFGFLGGAHAYVPGQGEPIYRDNEPVKEQEYLTDAFAREAEAYIDRHQGSPFFLYLTFNAVHTPMQADNARLAKFSSIADPKRQKYAAMMASMDDAVGRVVEKLRATKQEENTLVFFFSDNGGPNMKGTATNASDNRPLRGSKRTTLEGGVRVPFFVKWPAKLKAGQVYDKPVIQLDVLPTVLAAASTQAPGDAKLEGVDLLPYFTGEQDEAPHETLYWRFGGQRAIRDGDWKLVRYDKAVDGGKNFDITEDKLYNLADDLGEERDSGAQEPDRVKELSAKWNAWDEENVEPLWGSAQGKNKNKAARNRARRRAKPAA